MTANKNLLFLCMITLTLLSGCIKDEIVDDLIIDQDSIVLDETETKTVRITSGSNDYVVKSADENIAIATLVENNIDIKGVHEGETIIHVSDKKSEQRKQIKVTVNKLIIAVEGITLNPEKITVTDTKPFTLEVIILPENATNKNVRFQTTNADIATVDDKGVVTPVGSGRVVISAFTDDGNKEAICKLTVDLPIPEGVVIENGVLQKWPCDAVPESGRVVIPDYVTEIRKYAFKGCENIKKVIIPSSVTKIGLGAFQECTSLQEITIPGSVKNAGAYTFKGCAALQKIVLEEGVTQIFSGFLEGCINLTEVTLPGTIQKIDHQTFTECVRLPSITIPKGVVEISDRAFLKCTSLTKIDVAEENTAFASNDGILFNSKKDTIWRYPSAKEGTLYDIPSSVTHINAHAFDGMIKLKEVSIPVSVSTVGEDAFYMPVDNSGSLTLIWSKSTTPPTVQGWGLGYRGIVKVPAASVDAYKDAVGWSECTIQPEK